MNILFVCDIIPRHWIIAVNWVNEIHFKERPEYEVNINAADILVTLGTTATELYDIDLIFIEYFKPHVQEEAIFRCTMKSIPLKNYTCTRTYIIKFLMDHMQEKFQQIIAFVVQ